MELDIPLFVSDMSFGALSKEAKIALSMGAELAGTGICSGEGGMLPEEQANNSRYFYELASGKFGFSWDKVMKAQACNSNNCPVGIATQKSHLRQRLIIEASAQQLNNFFSATNELIKVVARSCGHDDVSKFNHNDLSTFDYDMHRLTGIHYAGAGH